MPILESRIERKRVRLMEAAGWLSLKLNVRGQTGWPDRLFLSPAGHILFVEFKRPGGRLSTRQSHIIKKLRDYGFQVEVEDGQRIW